MNLHQFTSKTFAGLESVLAAELKSLGASDVQISRRAVSFRGNHQLMVRANLQSRTAISIMQEVHRFQFEGKDDFFAQMMAFDWSGIMGSHQTFAVYPVASRSELFVNTMYLGQLTKDAIVDSFREKTGTRPNVDTDNPDMRIQVYVNNALCVVSIDSSGEPLFKRGYRRGGGEAPLNESLAAGLILLSGWNKEDIFIDPMCGSGTFSIEAAMIAKNTAPGLLRKEFGFSRWPGFDPGLEKLAREEAMDIQTPIRGRFIASDVNVKVLDVARKNIMEAGLMGQIQLGRAEFFSYFPPSQPGFVILNPPYGHRIRQDNMPDFYKKLGDFLKQHYKGYIAGIISQQLNGLRYVGLRPRNKYPVFNGALECRFVVYDLFSGSLKEHKSTERPRRPRITN